MSWSDRNKDPLWSENQRAIVEEMQCNRTPDLGNYTPTITRPIAPHVVVADQSCRMCATPMEARENLICDPCIEDARREDAE